MSNSIWHKYDVKDMPNTHDEILTFNGSHHSICVIDREDWEQGFLGCIKRWTYVSDIIAQADKAERLQKEITQELDIYYSPNPSLHPADDCIYTIEKIIGYKKTKGNNQ